MFDERDLLNVYRELSYFDESFLHPPTIANARALRKHGSQPHRAVIRVYDAAGNIVETHEHNGDFKEP